MSEDIRMERLYPLQFAKEDLEWMEACVKEFGRTGFARVREVSKEELKRQYPEK